MVPSVYDQSLFSFCFFLPASSSSHIYFNPLFIAAVDIIQAGTLSGPNTEPGRGSEDTSGPHV